MMTTSKKTFVIKCTACGAHKEQNPDKRIDPCELCKSSDWTIVSSDERQDLRK